MPLFRDMWWARWSLWTFGSAVLTSVVVGNAVYQKKQFYPTVVYITKSKPSMAVIYAQALLLVIMMGKLFRKIFFGQLRPTEFEHLVERSWYAVTETCLAFTVFRDDFSPKFLALFTLLLFLKSFHWLAEERVDYMERSPVITWIFHLRVLSLLVVLLILDVYFVNVAFQSIQKGPSVQLVFGFEYAILTTCVFNILAKYVFHIIDMQNEAPWDNKAVFVLHTEVIIGFIKVLLYISFVFIMVRIYTLPLFALRPTYLALRAFKKALSDVIMSRRAINNMNNLYPDVTPEELAATDNVCIICREEMTGGAKKLPCNHIFHISCLRSWFQRQQTCPTCRLNVLRSPVTPVQNIPPPFNPVFNNQQQGRVFAEQNQRFMQMLAGQGWIPRQGVNGEGQGNGGPAPNPTPDQTGGQNGGNANNEQGGSNQGAQQQQQPQFGYPHMSNMFQPTTQLPNQTAPFNIPPMPFIPLIPPPPPLLNVTGLTDEELLRLEGTSRKHLEERIKALRNIQILLDSATVQMQQYSATVTKLETSPSTNGERASGSGTNNSNNPTN